MKTSIVLAFIISMDGGGGGGGVVGYQLYCDCENQGKWCNNIGKIVNKK